MPLTISIVIPTYQRPVDLANCLDSILRQPSQPLEAIVVDNDAGKSAQTTVYKHEAKFGAQGIALRYEVSHKNSSPFARNLGVRLARGEIVLFLDDDVVLEGNYLGEILKVYEANPSALGVQGFVSMSARPTLWRRVFFLFHLESDVCRLLPSIQVIYPLKSLDAVIPCEFLMGCNASYRRSILLEFPGDENLIKYSYGEDVDQSYRIHKSHPGTLWMTPFARCDHRVSMVGRAIGRERTRMVAVYGLYLNQKLFPHTPRNLAIYWWSVLGRVLEFRRPSLKTYTELKYQLDALFFCLRHLREIRAGDLDFFNRTLEGNCKNSK